MNIDIMEQVKRLLENAGYPNVQVKRLDAFTGDMGTVITYAGYVKTHSYYDCHEEGEYSFALTTRGILPTTPLYDSAEEEMRDLLDEAIKLLDKRVIPSDNGSYTMVKGLELTGVPISIQSPDQTKAYMWQCKFTATIEF